MRLITFVWPRPPDVLTVLGAITVSGRRFVIVEGVPMRGGRIDIHNRASWLIRKDGIIADTPPYARPRD